MSASRLRPGRSAGESAARGLLAAAATALGWLTVTRTAAHMMRGQASEQAHALAPTDGRITALAALHLASAETKPADRVRADRLARAALRQDPTAVPAVIALGLNAQLKGDVQGARRLFAYSDRLSRRELQTQMWAIEDSVARRDLCAALHHYDVALRTWRSASDLLFPILAAAISEGPVRREVLRVLSGNSAWEASFVNVRPGLDPRRSRDPRFVFDRIIPTPFGWVPINEGGISTSLQRTGATGFFDFAAPATVGGPLLRQMQVLPPGDYRISGHSRRIGEVGSSRPYWMLSCGDGRELGRVDVPNVQRPNGAFSGRFTVPNGCATQTLMLVARPVDTPAGLSGQIDQVRLIPLHGSER